MITTIVLCVAVIYVQLFKPQFNLVAVIDNVDHWVRITIDCDSRAIKELLETEVATG